MVDNTVASPVLLQPIEFDADIVIHSLTKFLGGHGTTLGGVIVDGGRFPWERHAAHFPMLNEPDPCREVPGRAGLLAADLRRAWRDGGRRGVLRRAATGQPR